MHLYTTLFLLSFLLFGDVAFARPREHPRLVRRNGQSGYSWHGAVGRRNDTVRPPKPPVPPVPALTTLPPTATSLPQGNFTAPPPHPAPVTPLPPPVTPTTTSGLPTQTPMHVTIANGETKEDVPVGAIVAAGVGGGYLLLAGQYFAMAAGSVAQVTGGIGSGLGGLASGLLSLGGSAPTKVDKPGNNNDDPEDPEDPDDPDDPDDPEEPEQTTSQGPTSTSEPPTTTTEPPTTTEPTTTTTTTHSAAHTPYIIFPDAAISDDDFQSVRASLSTLSDSEIGSFREEEDDIVWFFTASLTRTDAQGLAIMPGIDYLSPDDELGDLFELAEEQMFRQEDFVDPTGPPPALLKDPLSVAIQPKQIVRQYGYGLLDDGAPPEHEKASELAVLSQEPGKFTTSTFAYDKVAGAGITVYILGTGVNMQSPDIKDARGSIDFIYAPGSAIAETDDAPGLGFSDGTCFASKIVGPSFGVAKKASVVMVKVSGQKERLGTIHFIEMITVLAMIKNDIYVRGIKGKVVVNLSYTTPMDDPDTITVYKEFLLELINNDIVLVASTGNSHNNADSTANDQYPAAFAKDTPLIAVSATNRKGQQMDWSPGTVEDGVTVAAPATGMCAFNNVKTRSPSTWNQELSSERLYYSESVAAVTVSGVIATLMAQEDYQEQLQVPGKVAANVKELVMGLAWPRAEGGPPMVWNGVKPLASTICRKQEGESCEYLPPGNTTTTAPPTMLPTSTTTTTTTSPWGTPTPAPAPPATTPDPVKPAPKPDPEPDPEPEPSTPNPKPTWDNIPNTWSVAYEGDGVYSSDYTSSFDSASDKLNGDPMAWCLAKCTILCRSVFLVRVKQEGAGEYFVCNRYDMTWTDDFIQKGSVDQYDAGIALTYAGRISR